jgi:hypothetical protein
MNGPRLAGGLIAIAALLAASASLAAEPLLWPWKDKTPPDPALTQLSSVQSVTVSIGTQETPTITITAEVTAPNPGFSELQFTPRMGDPNDLIFALDAKGRPPQDVATQAPTSVTVTAEYRDAPIAKVGVIEVHGEDNCKAFSVKENKETDCTSTSMPQ